MFFVLFRGSRLIDLEVRWEVAAWQYLCFSNSSPRSPRPRMPPKSPNWCQEVRLGPPLPRAPGIRMTWVKQTPSNYQKHVVNFRHVFCCCCPRVRGRYPSGATMALGRYWAKLTELLIVFVFCWECWRVLVYFDFVKCWTQNAMLVLIICFGFDMLIFWKFTSVCMF